MRWSLVALLISAGAALTGPASADGVPITITYVPSPAMEACIEGIRAGKARIGMDEVTTTFVATTAARTTATLTAVHLRSTRDPEQPGGGHALWQSANFPYLFRDAAHFRKFQESGIADEIESDLFTAYGGAHHLLTFRAAVTEPRHFKGIAIAGSETVRVYQSMGALESAAPYAADLDREWRLKLPQLARRIASDLGHLKTDRESLAGAELPLLDLAPHGLDRTRGYLNLTFASIEPIIIDPYSLTIGAPKTRKAAIKVWARELARHCSQGVLAAEEKALASLKAAGTTIVPVNRAAIAQVAWRQGLETGPTDVSIPTLERIAALGWTAQAGTFSRLLSKLDADVRQRWEEHAAQERERAKSTRELLERIRRQEAEDAPFDELWGSLRDVVAEALANLPPPAPSGWALREVDLPRRRVQVSGSAHFLADEMQSLLDSVKECPPEELIKEGCRHRVDAWLAVARARSAHWSSYLTGREARKAIDRALALIGPPSDASPRDRLIAAELLHRVAEAQWDTGDERFRETIDRISAIDLSQSSLSTGEALKPGPGAEHYSGKDVLDIYAWLGRNYRALGDQAAVARTLARARSHALIRQASGTGLTDWRTIVTLRNLALLSDDRERGWRELTRRVSEAPNPGELFCDFGETTCRDRLDIRRIYFHTLNTYAVAALEAPTAPREEVTFRKSEWLLPVVMAFHVAGYGGLESEMAGLAERLRALAPTIRHPERRGYLEAALAFQAADAAGRQAIVCKFMKCMGYDSAEPAYANSVAPIPAAGPDRHAFTRAVADRDWSKAAGWLDAFVESAQTLPEEDAHDRVFPQDSGRASYDKHIRNFAEVLAENAAVAGETRTLKRALGHLRFEEGDRELTASRRFNTLMRLLSLSVVSLAR